MAERWSHMVCGPLPPGSYHPRVIRCASDGNSCSAGVIRAIGAVVGVYALQLLGLAPRPLASLMAWLLHAPEDVFFYLMKRRPFNFTRVHGLVLVGRMPRSTADLDSLYTVILRPATAVSSILVSIFFYPVAETTSCGQNPSSHSFGDRMKTCGQWL